LIKAAKTAQHDNIIRNIRYTQTIASHKHNIETTKDLMSDTPCSDECNYLIELAHRLETSIEDAGERLKLWHESANALLQSPDIESLAGERALEQLSLQLRSEWLRYANSISSCYLKSPPSFQLPRIPSGDTAATPYDRWMQPIALEKRANNYHRVPEGWHADHVMFNTGMGAITCMLLVMRTMFHPRAASPLRFHGLGGYFEIMDLITANNDELFQARIFQDQKQLRDSVSVGGSQLLYIEPVSCRFNLDIFDLEKFLSAWKQRPGNIPTILIFDTTLTGNLFPIEEVLTRTDPYKPAVVIQISSTLKLDQEGLEFSNGGLMSVYSTKPENTADMSFRMRRFRSAMGLGLNMDQIAALDYPGFLEQAISDRHSAAIFETNEYVARRVDAGDGLLFDSISHPALNGDSTCPWAVAPFVYLRLRKGSNKEDLEFLKYVFFTESQKRNMTFQPGSSFGFRGHRCELGGIRDVPGYETIRVAMGCRRGPNIQEAIQLINELSHMQTFDKLRAKYPALVEVARNAAEQKKKHFGRA